MKKEDDVTRWEKKAEQINTCLADEYFKLEVGKRYSQQKIARWEAKNNRHAQYFLEQFRTPRALFIDSVNKVLKANTYRLTLQLHKLRKTKICVRNVKFNRAPVCWTNWRQFAAQAPDKKRKIIFDAFIRKTPAITPVIQAFFDKAKETYAQYGLDPLQVYCEEHKISVEQLKETLYTVGNAVKVPFQQSFEQLTQKFLGRKPKYYDDFYFMRNLAFEDLTQGFVSVNSEKYILKLLHELGFKTDNITVDSADRPKKYPSPFCSFVRIPTDIRVSYKPENPLQTAVALYHEFGHAAHASSIQADLSYDKKYVLSDGLAETFSIFFENLLADKNYLVQVLHLPEEYARKLVQRIRFTEQYAIVFYVANSLLKINQWENMLSPDQMNEVYAKHLRDWLGLEVDGSYWQLHHILPESLMYVPSYLLAMVQAHQFTEHLKKTYGTWWWAHKRAGQEIKAMMVSGADSPLADFSKLDVASFVRSFDET